MGFINDLIKILSKNPKPEEELKDKDQRALEWATRIGDTEGSANLQEKSVLSTREARLNATKTTPVDAVLGVLARKNERRDIRIGAAVEAVKMGSYAFGDDFAFLLSTVLICYSNYPLNL